MAPHVTPTTKLQIIGAFKLLRFLRSRHQFPPGTVSNNDIFRLFSVSRTTGYRVLSEISSGSDFSLSERLALDAETAAALEEEENARIAEMLNSPREETRGRKRKLTERDVEIIEHWLDRNGGRGDVKWADVPRAAGLGAIPGKNGEGVLSGVTVKRALREWRERNKEVDVEDWTRARGKGGLRGSEKARERWGKPKSGGVQGGEEGQNGQGVGQERNEEEGSESESDESVVETGAGPSRAGAAQLGTATASGSNSAAAPEMSTTTGYSDGAPYAGAIQEQEQQNTKKRRSASGPQGPDPRNLWNNRWEIEKEAVAKREAEAKAAARAQLKIQATNAAKERYRLNRQRKRQQQKLEKQQQQERERLQQEQQQAQQSYTAGQQQQQQGYTQPQQLPQPHSHQQQQGQRPYTSMSFIPLPTYGQPSGPSSAAGSGSNPSSAHQSFNNPSSAGGTWNANPNNGGEAEDIMMLGRLSGVIR